MNDTLIPLPVAKRRFPSWHHLETLQQDNQIVLKTRRTPAFRGFTLACLTPLAVAWAAACVRFFKESATLLATGLTLVGISAAVPLVRRLLRRDTLIRFDPATRRIHTNGHFAFDPDACRIRELHLNTYSTQKTFVYLVTPDNCHELFRVEETRPKVSPIGILCQTAGIDYRIKAVTSKEELSWEIESLRETANHKAGCLSGNL